MSRAVKEAFRNQICYFKKSYMKNLDPTMHFIVIVTLNA